MSLKGFGPRVSRTYCHVIPLLRRKVPCASGSQSQFTLSRAPASQFSAEILGVDRDVQALWQNFPERASKASTLPSPPDTISLLSATWKVSHSTECYCCSPLLMLVDELDTALQSLAPNRCFPDALPLPPTSAKPRIMAPKAASMVLFL